MTNPTEKTLKPSDSILHRVNATREPNLRPLTLDGGWEPGDTQSVVIAMLRDLDEQHAAEQADRAGLPRPSVTAQPQPFAANSAMLRTDCRTPGCWFHAGHVGRCSPDKSEPPAQPSALDVARKEIRRLEEAMAHEIKRHAYAELSRYAAWSNSASMEKERVEALAKVEELTAKLQAHADADGIWQSMMERDLTAATSRAEAAEARVAEMERERPHLVEGCEYVF